MTGLKPTHAKTPRPPKAAILPPVKPAVPTQQPTTVADMVNAQVNPLLLQLQQQQASLDAQHNQQRQAIQQATTQFLAYLQGGDKSVQGDYNAAAQAIAGFAQEGAGLLSAANPNTDAQAVLSAINAPAEQKGAVAQQNTNVYAGGAAALYGLQGLLPGSTLESQGAAAAAYQKALPGVVAAQGLQNLNRFAYQSELDNRQLADQRAQIIAKIPGLTADAQASVNEQLFKQQQFAYQRGQDRVSNAQKAKQLQLEGAAYGLKANSQAFNQKVAGVRLTQAQQRINNQQNQFIAKHNQTIAIYNAKQKNAQSKLALPNSSLSGKLGYLADSAGNPILNKKGGLVVLPGYRVQNGQIVKVGSKSGGYSAVKIQAWKGAAYAMAESAKANKISWGALLDEARKHGIPIAIALPQFRMFYRRGELGRPSPAVTVTGKGGLGITVTMPAYP